MSSQLSQTCVPLRSRPTGEWFVHPDLRTRMLQDAQARGTSLTDLTVQILCQHFHVPYTPNVRKSSPAADKDQLMLRLPFDLESAISGAYPRRMSHGIRSALSAHYSLPLPVREKQTRTRRPRVSAT